MQEMLQQNYRAVYSPVSFQGWVSRIQSIHPRRPLDGAKDEGGAMPKKVLTGPPSMRGRVLCAFAQKGETFELVHMLLIRPGEITEQVFRPERPMV